MKNPQTEVSRFIVEAEPSKPALEAAALVFQDLIAALVGGYSTPTVAMLNQVVRQEWREGHSSVFSGNFKTTAAAAALANANCANALDVDDSINPVKGHPAAGVVPAAVAVAEQEGSSGQELLEAIAIGYEVAVHAAQQAHQIRPEYHGTGSWVSLGAAAAAARLRNLTDQSVIDNALGLCEYHSPYAPILRSVNYPSMAKDGISFGSFIGVISLELAERGFTGIRHLLEDTFLEPTGEWWVERADFKSYSCCHWAQPSMHAAHALLNEHNLQTGDIQSVTLRVFSEATELSILMPESPEEAQYNLIYPVACLLVDSDLLLSRITEPATDPYVEAMMTKISAVVDPECEEIFPLRQLGGVIIETTDGRTLDSGVQEALGNSNNPLPRRTLDAKALRLLESQLSEDQALQLLRVVQTISGAKDLSQFSDLMQSA